MVGVYCKEREKEGENWMIGKKQLFLLAVSTAALSLTACIKKNVSKEVASVPDINATKVSDLERRLQQERENAKILNDRIAELSQRVTVAEQEAANAQSTDSGYDNIALSAGYPPDAKPGQCFARVLIPEVTETVTEQVVDTPERTEIKTIPARYEIVDEQVLVKEETTVYEAVPARYETITEEVVLEGEGIRTEVIPAEYETYQEQILVRPAYTTWKPGSGLIGREGVSPYGKTVQTIIQPTGEILCKVEVPAEYKTVTRKRLVRSEEVREIPVPGKTKTITKQVIAEPARVVERVIPAVYKTVPVRKMVEPPREDRTIIPATYKTIEKVQVVDGGDLQWREVLCDTNTTAEITSRIQQALKDKGYNPGRIDGIFGHSTLIAMERFQRDNNLIVGQLTMQTVEALGVDI